MDAYIGLDFNDPVDGLDKTADDIFLPKSQTARAALRVILSGSEMGIGQMADSHGWKYITPAD